MMLFNDCFVVINSGSIAELEKLEFYTFPNDFLILNDAFLTFILTVENSQSNYL